MEGGGPFPAGGALDFVVQRRLLRIFSVEICQDAGQVFACEVHATTTLASEVHEAMASRSHRAAAVRASNRWVVTTPRFSFEEGPAVLRVLRGREQLGYALAKLGKLLFRLGKSLFVAGEFIDSLAMYAFNEAETLPEDGA